MSEDLRELYTSVFRGETERIPMIVMPPCGPMPSGPELASDTANAVRRAAESLRPKVDVGADWIPAINIGWYQGIVVPSLFGARLAFPDGSEPIAEPLFASMQEALDAGIPPIRGAVVDEMLRTVAKAVASLPDGFELSFPATASPFDLAQLLLPGEEFLIATLMEPDAVRVFLDNLTNLCWGVFDLVEAEMGRKRRGHVTNRGVYFPGLRLPCDAIVNLSPDLIRNLVLPVLSDFGRRYGALCVHYCTAPAPSAHVLPILSECDCVAAVDNWQGPDVFLGDDAPARLQSKVAVIMDVDLSSSDKMAEFLDWEPVRDIPRQGGRGLVVSITCDSVQRGREIYSEWRQRVR